MSDSENRITEIEREISALPAGSLAVKKINNRVYYYHRVSTNGKRKEIFVSSDEADELQAKILHRKKLEKELKDLQKSMPGKTTVRVHPEYVTTELRTWVRIGETLRKFTEQASGFKKRECFAKINDFLYDTSTEKVLILYGLRRTGKTTLIRQAIAEMGEKEFAKTVFLQIKPTDTLADVNADLKMLEAAGFKYVFIDEVTLMKDFIEGGALFSDIFAASGMKIVLSGTDSLGFVFSEDEQLYDRCIMVHTTFIPFREFEQILGLHDVDTYIRYGGTLCPSGTNYNADSCFSDSKKVGEYVDTSIAKNIQHSLRYYQNGNHLRSLKELYDKNELTNAINRVVEDMNHTFAVETITRTFESADLALSANNLRRDRNNPTDILDRIDTPTVTEKLRRALEILNKNEQKVAVTESHVAEIKQYLVLLDLIVEIDIKHAPATGARQTLSIVTQPGMRYVQATELVNSLVSDEVFAELGVVERSQILGRICDEIKGRMMEEIILLETKLANPGMKVFKLQFAVGEFDMVVFDPATLTCRIYEIKHSKEAVASQYRHLIDEEKCAEAEKQYGRIEGRYVIYRGSPLVENGVEYLNAEEYLRNL